MSASTKMDGPSGRFWLGRERRRGLALLEESARSAAALGMAGLAAEARTALERPRLTHRLVPRKLPARPVPEAIADYEQVSVYALDDAEREELLRSCAECTFNWATRDGWPVGVIMSYLWKDGRFWLTAGAQCVQRLDSPLRVVLEVAPDKWITYDGVKMFRDAAGRLPAGEKSASKSSDTVRLERELRRRGLAQEKR